jgi:hypothetical protein
MPAPLDMKRKLTDVSSCQPGQRRHEGSVGVNKRQQYVSEQSAATDSNLAHEIRRWIEAEPRKFHVSEVDKDLNFTSKCQKDNRSKVIERLLKAGIIERTGNVRGYYQLISHDCPEIDFLSQENSIFPLSLPFQLDEMVKIMPGNIILVAGSQNAGKSALLLNIILNNNTSYADRMHYFSSECASELRGRLELFEGMSLREWRFKAYERSHSFHQVIRPNDINLVDYLEIHDDFFKIGSYLAEIQNKLKEGIAIVALQKNPGSDAGLGGNRGLEKPRLYLSLDANPPDGNRIKIVKAKHYIGENPNGKELDFKLLGGWKFVRMSGWRHVTKGKAAPSH